MIRLAFLAVAVAAFVVLWGVAPGYGLLVAFLVLFAHFATTCILYDRPKDRARLRVAAQLRGMLANSEEAQRLSTRRIVPSADDRRLGIGPMTALNFATGIAAAGLLIWGIVLRTF